MESNLPSWITDGRMMFGDAATRQASTLQMVKNQPNSLAAQIATAVLIAAFWAPAQGAAPSPTLSQSIRPNVGGAAGQARDIRLAAAPGPKIAVPQVHVNLGAHPRSPKIFAPQLRVNAGNVDGVTAANSSAVKLKSAHRFRQNIHGRGKAFAGDNGTGEGASVRTLNFTHIQVEYKPQSDNGSLGKSGTGQSK